MSPPKTSPMANPMRSMEAPEKRRRDPSLIAFAIQSSLLPFKDDAKSPGFGRRNFLAGPSPLPVAPWHDWHFCVYTAFALCAPSGLDQIAPVVNRAVLTTNHLLEPTACFILLPVAASDGLRFSFTRSYFKLSRAGGG